MALDMGSSASLSIGPVGREQRKLHRGHHASLFWRRGCQARPGGHHSQVLAARTPLSPGDPLAHQGRSYSDLLSLTAPSLACLSYTNHASKASFIWGLNYLSPLLTYSDLLQLTKDEDIIMGHVKFSQEPFESFREVKDKGSISDHVGNK